MPKGTPFDNVHIRMFAVASTKSKLNIVHSTKKNFITRLSLSLQYTTSQGNLVQILNIAGITQVETKKRKDDDLIRLASSAGLNP